MAYMIIINHMKIIAIIFGKGKMKDIKLIVNELINRFIFDFAFVYIFKQCLGP